MSGSGLNVSAWFHSCQNPTKCQRRDFFLKKDRNSSSLGGQEGRLATFWKLESRWISGWAEPRGQIGKAAVRSAENLLDVNRHRGWQCLEPLQLGGKGGNKMRRIGWKTPRSPRLLCVSGGCPLPSNRRQEFCSLEREWQSPLGLRNDGHSGECEASIPNRRMRVYVGTQSCNLPCSADLSEKLRLLLCPGSWPAFPPGRRPRDFSQGNWTSEEDSEDRVLQITLYWAQGPLALSHSSSSDQPLSSCCWSWGSDWGLPNIWVVSNMGGRPQTNQQNDTGNLEETNHARRQELEKAINNTHQGWRGLHIGTGRIKRNLRRLKIGS